MLTAKLIVDSGSSKQSYEMHEGKPLFAGRTVECDLHLPSPAVSRRHAVFLVKGGHCGVKDLASSNGTYLNGKRITKPMRLKSGDIIQIAGFQIEFNLSETAPYDDADQTVLLKTTGSAADTNDKLPAPAVAPEPQPAAEPPARPAVPEPSVQPVADDDGEPFAADESHTPVMDMIEDAAPAGQAEAKADATDGLPDPVDDDHTRELDETPYELPSESEAEAVDDDAPKPAPLPVDAQPAADAGPVAKPRIERPERAVISDEEVGDGSADADFVMEDEQAADESEKDMALAKAAAEAGLVGEFAPDLDEEQPQDPEGAATPDAALPFAVSLEITERPEVNPNAIPLDKDFRQAIETRLYLYSFLADMKSERDDLIARRPKMADAVKAELARQDRELDKIPTAAQAENMIEKRRAKQDDLMRRIREAKEKELPPPPKPSREMREAEEMAISQWTFCVQSEREALPAVYREGFKLMRDEPLAECLSRASLDPVPLMGGGAYLLALEEILDETKFARAQVRTKLAGMTAPDDKKQNPRARGVFGLFGKGANKEEDEDEVEEAGESYEQLIEHESHLALKSAWITQEMAYMEKALVAEFWRVYTDAALHFLPHHERMPMPVRAFLRHGAIGFKKWWMPDAVRNHIIDDCTNEVVHHVAPSRNYTNVLYADEYLAAIMNWECTPAMDENLEINERNSPNWKADKALRKLINAQSQSVLMEELLESLSQRIGRLQADADVLDEKISKLLAGSKNYKQMKNEMSQQRQAFRVEITKLTNLSKKIKTETLASLKEAGEETRERFSSGELPRPTTDFMIRRECEAIHKIGRLLANLKERFMPLILRDNFIIDTDAVNDRLSVRGIIHEMERRDPAIFLETIVPSKKKANRVDLRISPIIVLVPSAGVLAFSWNPRQKPEDGRLAIPTCFIRRRIRERQITYLLSDFRWDTSKAAAGMDILTSETIVAAFMGVRWDWRKRSKEAREKGLIYSEQNDRTNWRRVYEAYSQTAFDGGKKLYNRNYDFYERIIGKYFDMPEDVQLLRK